MAHKFQPLVKLNFSVLYLTQNFHLFHTSRTKSLDLIKVLSNSTWGGDRKVILRSYRALIQSTLDYESVFVWFCKTVINKAMRRTRLPLQYGVKLMSNELVGCFSIRYCSQLLSKRKGYHTIGIKG